MYNINSLIVFFCLFFFGFSINFYCKEDNKKEKIKIKKKIENLREEIQGINFSRESINTFLEELETKIKNKEYKDIKKYIQLIKDAAIIIKEENITVGDTKKCLLLMIDYLIDSIQKEREITIEELDKKIKNFFIDLEKNSTNIINKFFNDLIKDSNKIIKKIVFLSVSTAVFIKTLFWIIKIFKTKYKNNKKNIKYDELLISSGISFVSLLIIINSLKL
jgi:hypothetical protein